MDKISQALQKLTNEDLTLKAVNDAENRPGHGAAHHLLLEHKSLIQIVRGAETHFHMTILPVTPCLPPRPHR